ncbi:type IV pilus secretin family protein [Thioalkalivibrio paradoxus]|nr:type IV pilus secretin family protein [Thioalkalivibrio paradoxus]
MRLEPHPTEGMRLNAGAGIAEGHPNRSLARRLAVWFATACLLLAGPLPAQELNDIRASDLGADRVQLSLRFSEPPPDARIFVIDSPPRIALDLPGVANRMRERTTEFNLGPLLSATAVEAGDRTRVVLNLARSSDYQSRVDGNNLILTVGRGAGAVDRVARAPEEPAVAPEPAAPAVEDPPARPPGVRSARPPEIVDVDFRRGEDGQGRVLVELSRPGVSVDVREQAGRVELLFPRVLIEDRLERRLDVVDFATPVTHIDTERERDERVRMTVHGTGEYEVLSYQTDRTYVLELAPLTEEEREARRIEEEEFVGERLSLNFQDIEVRSVLQLLADFTDMNIVVSDSVTGNITLRLNNVPWDQALDIILQTRGLDKRVSGNVMYVAPTEEIAARERLILEAQRDRRELEPLRTEFITVNFTQAADIERLIQVRERTDREGRVSFLSDRGSVAVDTRTNVLIVRDTQEQIDQIRQLVTTLDIPTRQVLIETRLVIAEDDFARQLGARFGVAAGSRQGRSNIGTGARIPDASGIAEGIADGTRFRPGSVNVPLPATGLTGFDTDPSAVAFTILRPNIMLDLELSALQAERRGEIISNPRVITTNGQEAKIVQGDRIPFITRDEAGNPITEFEDALLETTVTPQITPNGDVIMELTIKKDEPGVVTRDGIALVTRELETTVRVANGETVVLGGIYEITSSDLLEKTPFFGDIPFVRHFFQRKTNDNRKVELLVFVTPRVLD